MKNKFNWLIKTIVFIFISLFLYLPITNASIEPDEIFITDEAPDLDVYTFRSEGPIEFDIEIPRVFSRDNNDWDELIKSAKLILRIWDVDEEGAPPDVGPEVDIVYINGHQVPKDSEGGGGHLTGANNQWSTWTFHIPTEWFENGWVNTATYKGSNKEPTPGINHIKIDIDTQVGWAWAVTCDWGKFEIEAVRPSLLVPGFLSSIAWRSPEEWADFRNYIEGALFKQGEVDWNGTIVANSSEVADLINETKIEFGVEKINIIAHSKGGLDSRECIEGRDDVKSLIMLGTPNRGSEKADHIVDAHPWKSRLASPGINNLTTTFMDRYNTGKSSNSLVNYRVIAGNLYDADYRIESSICRCDDGQGIKPFNGPNDGSVAVNRAALPWRSSVDITTALDHQGLLHDQSLYNNYARNWLSASLDPLLFPVKKKETIIVLLKNIQKVFSPFVLSLEKLANIISPEVAIAQGETHLPLQMTPIIYGELNSGETVINQVVIDPSNSALFHSLVQGTGDFEFILYTPSNTRIDSSTTDPNIKYDETKNLGIKEMNYFIKNPEVGVWRMGLIASASGSYKEAVEVESFLELSASTDKDSYSVGDPVEISALIKDKIDPISGASVNAKITKDEVLFDTVTLSHKGSGLYSETFITTEGGVFNIDVIASGKNLMGYDFVRQASTPISVTPNSISLTGDYSAYPIDNNNNSLYDYLILEAGVNITKNGKYKIIARLDDNQGNPIIEGSNYVDLSIGYQNVLLKFNGEVIRSSEKDGPYQIVNLSIYDINNQGLTADHESFAYTTSAYNYLDFEGPLVKLKGTGKDYGKDTNFNGLYDYLTIELDVDILVPGYYAFNGRLEDSSGFDIEWGSGETYLNKGKQVIVINFDGEPIGNSSKNGPYQVRDLHIYNKSQSKLQDTLDCSYTTSSYEYTQFEGADTTPPNVEINIPQSNDALQDGVTFEATASDNCEVAELFFFVREPGGANGIPIGYENLSTTLNNSGKWEHNLDTTLLPDGYYVLLAKAIDENGNEGWSELVPFSIRNWSVIQLLPASKSYRAGRTMPVKFSLRIAAAVDPAQPFVYNEDLEIRVYNASALGTPLQVSLYGDISTDYRINTDTKLYITNFKTDKKPMEYLVEIWRTNKNFLIDSFTFETTKK